MLVGYDKSDCNFEREKCPPTIEKKVKENDNWDTDSNAKIGDKVEYQVTIHAKKGAENYVLTDTMDNGLTFNNDIVVKAGTNNLELNKDYTVKTDGIKDTFELTFTKTYLDNPYRKYYRYRLLPIVQR